LAKVLGRSTFIVDVGSLATHQSLLNLPQLRGTASRAQEWLRKSKWGTPFRSNHDPEPVRAVGTKACTL
ncbi:hypothetical protein HOY80DRAFT_881767, partial [Tuber brumale]